MIACEQWHLEFVASRKAPERMAADDKKLCPALIKTKSIELIESSNSRLPKDVDRRLRC